MSALIIQNLIRQRMRSLLTVLGGAIRSTTVVVLDAGSSVGITAQESA
jgi:hypothetical protein